MASDGAAEIRDLSALKRRTGSIDTEVLATAIQEGTLDPLAERAAMAELARRVVADEDDCSAGGVSYVPTTLVLGPVLAAALVLGVWVALLLASSR
jgi:Arc/MetJ family transcription regulator